MSDAIERLEAGHRRISALLARGTRSLSRLAAALESQAGEEQEVFYPALRKAAGRGFAPAIVDAVGQHRRIHDLISELGRMPAGAARRRAFEELQARIEEHVEHVEHTVFPEALRRLSRAERLALGERMDLLTQAR